MTEIANLPTTATPPTTSPRAELVAGGRVAAIIPRTIEETFRISTAVIQSGLAPKGFSTPQQVVVAIMTGAELGFAPMQALQSIAVINGRPTVWGDGLMALARSGGHRVAEWIAGDGEKAVAHCRVTRADTGEQIERTFSVGDAKRAGLWGKGGPWTQYPTRMLQMRARSWALRDGLADVLRGVRVGEEERDHQGPDRARDVTPRREGQRLAAMLDDAPEDVPPVEIVQDITADDIPDPDALFAEIQGYIESAATAEEIADIVASYAGAVEKVIAALPAHRERFETLMGVDA